LNDEYQVAINALRKKDYKEAEEIFSRIIEQKPENAESHLGISFALIELNNANDAEKHLEASTGLFEAQNKSVEMYISAKKLQMLKPEFVKYTFTLLRAYLKIEFMRSFTKLLIETMKKTEISEDMLRENISSIIPLIKDENIKPLLSFGKERKLKEEEKLNPFENYELANLLFEIGSTDEAKAEYYKTAQAFLKKDLTEKAQELYAKIKEFYPDDSGLSSLKNDIDNYGIGKEEMSIENRKTMLEDLLPTFEDKNEVRVRYSSAVVLKEYFRFKEAEEEIEKICNLPKSPEKIKSYILLSQIYIDSKKNEKAIEVLNNVIESNEFTPEELVPLNYKLGTLFERIGKLSEALLVYENAMESNPDYLNLIEKVRGVKERIEKKSMEETKEVTEEEVLAMETSTSEGFLEKEEVEEKKITPEVEKEIEVRERILYI